MTPTRTLASPKSSLASPSRKGASPSRRRKALAWEHSPALAKELPDGRYSVQLEYCGYSGPRHVARFCGEWVTQFRTKAASIRACFDHAAKRNRILGGGL